MKVLFVHQNFPAQFLHISRKLPDARAITDIRNPTRDFIPTIRYIFDSDAASSLTGLGRVFGLHAARAEGAARAMLHMRRSGYQPDVVVGHVGWGETMFVKDVWPETRLIVHAEFYYSSSGADVGFDAEFPRENATTDVFRLRTQNAAILASLIDADVGVAPTEWQASRFPSPLRNRIEVVHEGIDTEVLVPDRTARFAPAGTNLSFGADDEVITFVSRNLEPYRGYHTLMRALPEILAARPNAHAIIVGGNDTSYGVPPPAPGQSWKDFYLDEVKGQLPLHRIHFAGLIAYDDFVRLMQISSVHVYLTYPFVLSWSMLEAMSAGALVVASRTAPVTEVIAHGRNGLLVDFFDPSALARSVIDVLRRPADFHPLRAAARRTIVEGYDLRSVCLPRWRQLLEVPSR